MKSFPVTRKKLIAGILAWGFLGGHCVSLAQYDLHDNAWEHNRRGEWQLQRRNYVGALQEFQASLSLRPAKTQEAAFQNNLGMSYLGLASLGYKTQGLAIDAFQSACRLAPTYALYRQNLVRAHAQAGQLGEFEKELLRIVVANPQDADGWFLLGLVYRMQQDPERAKPSFENYLKLQPYSEMARAAQQLLRERIEPEGEGHEGGEGKSEEGAEPAKGHESTATEEKKHEPETKPGKPAREKNLLLEKPAGKAPQDARLKELNSRELNNRELDAKKSSPEKSDNSTVSGKGQAAIRKTSQAGISSHPSAQTSTAKPKAQAKTTPKSQSRPQYGPSAVQADPSLKPLPRKEPKASEEKGEPVRMRLSPPPGLNPKPESEEEAKPNPLKHENPAKTEGSSKAELKSPAGLEPKTGLNRKPEIRQLGTPSKTPPAETGRE